MTDAEFLSALQSCTLPQSEFGHQGHVRAAYLFLREADFAAALGKMRGAIRNYSAHLGKPDRYHETITVAYVALIHQCLQERGDGGSWQEFARRVPELLQADLLLKFYPCSLLESDLARKVFLLPPGGIGGI